LWRPLAAAVLLGLIATPLAAATAAEQYTTALARERALRASIESGGTSELRALMAAYEELARVHPQSGYSDNALWQAAGLALLAFERHRDDRDLELGRDLLELLGRKHPASSLVARIPARLQEFARLLDPVELRRITRASGEDMVTVTIELDAEVDYLAERLDEPPRLYFDFNDTFTVPPLRNATLDYPDGGLVRQIRLGRHAGQVTRVVLDLANVESYRFYTLDDPYQLVVEAVAQPRLLVPTENNASVPPVSVEPAFSPASLEVFADTQADELHRLELLPVPETLTARRLAPLPGAPRREVGGLAAQADLSAAPAMHDILYPALGDSAERVASVVYGSELPGSIEPVAPARNAAGALSLGRQLGLGVSRVVIDAGHGGYDSGARAADLTESALVLDVALRLEQRLAGAGIEVVQTRRDDLFVPLRTRTELANRVGGDLFLSIHANAAGDTRARGIETYYLDLTHDPMAQMVAARENALATDGMRHLPALLGSIATNNKLDESQALAELVQRHLVDGIRELHPDAQDLGVKRAPFVVLIGATMPSVLAEISFLTNAQEAAFLATDAYRDRIAEALFHAVIDYQSTLKPFAISADDENSEPSRTGPSTAG
tara:strand:- start:265 stop:2094 length:1830 start_codon:yes stop_codon:yes gene_type:complete